jgi:YebC/PmpR family DNA-binding regulatory protein
MSGHSKWSTIKHGKAVTDARRSALFTKLAKEVIIAARQGGGSPDSNFRLRMAVQRAKASNMPSDSIDRAIKRGAGEDDGQDRIEEVTYEGYGPGGMAILLQALTDNRNRTVSELRSTLTKTGGNMADAGSVAWQFQQKGTVVVDIGPEEAEELALVAIDAGAEDFETEDRTLLAYSTPETLEKITKSLAEHGGSIRSSEVSMVPNNTIPLDAKTAGQALTLLDRLEELDDIQKVFSNADFPDEALEEYSGEE